MSHIDDLANNPEHFKRLIASGRIPHGIDLLAAEERIKLLDAKEKELAERSKLLPGNKRALADLRSERIDLHWFTVSAREHVSTNPVSLQSYEAEKKLRADAEKQSEQRNKEHDAQETKEQAARKKRAYLREFMKQFSEKQREKEPERGQEKEPEREM